MVTEIFSGDYTGAVVTSTFRARQLGRRMAELRRAAELSQRDAATIAGCSQGLIAQYENGKAPIKPERLPKLLRAYGADDATIAKLASMRAEANDQGWWTILPGEIGDFVALEYDAATERAFELEVIPGPLQTEAYAREVHVLRGGLSPQEIDGRVAGRMQRKNRLTAAVNPLDLTATISESALLRCVEPGDMIGAAQLRYLHEVAQLSNVHLHILPISRGRHAGMQGGYILLTFPDEMLHDMAWQEYALGGAVVDVAADVAKLVRLDSEIRGQALGCDESLAMIADLVQKIL